MSKIGFKSRNVFGKSTESTRKQVDSDRGGSRGRLGRSPPKTYETNSIHQDFVKFGKQHSRYEAILPSIVLSQQCCEVFFISLIVVNPQ